MARVQQSGPAMSSERQDFGQIRRLVTLILFALTCPLSAWAQNIEVQETRWQVGDNSEWALPKFNDDEWAPISTFTGAPVGVFWIREQVAIDGSEAATDSASIVVEGAGAFQIFFDGVLLGGSGEVGSTRVKERPGTTSFALGVPPALLSNGRHLIAFRASAVHLARPEHFFVEYRFVPSQANRARDALNMLALGGAFAAATILLVYFAVGSFSRSQRTTFLTAMSIAGGIVVIVLIEALDRSGLIIYPFRPLSDIFAMIGALTLFLALPAFLIFRFRLARSRSTAFQWAAAVFAVFLLAAPSWPQIAFDHDTRAFLLLCVFCVLVSVIAARSGHREAMPFAIVFSLLAAGIALDPQSLYLFLVLLSVFLSVTFADHLRQQQLVAKQAEVTAARLEAEMLRRNIQPHFLMNSLTAITEWIETAPVEALRFIDGLADEFRSLTDLSAKTTTSLAEEIDLCRVHLNLMGMRKRRAFHLDTDGVDVLAEIPPGVLHTLIENALSHNKYEDDNVTFILRETRDNDGRTLILTTPLGKSTQHGMRSTGSGLQYVRSRLEESFPGRWRFTSAADKGNWVSEIFIAAAQ